SGQNVCCTSRNGRGVGTLKLLSRSAVVWKSGNFKSSLGLPKTGDDYHAKVLMSEYIPIGHYAVQDSRPTEGGSTTTHRTGSCKDCRSTTPSCTPPTATGSRRRAGSSIGRRRTRRHTRAALPDFE